MTKRDGSVIAFSYDERGRRTGIDYPAGQTDVSLTYDEASRRTAVTDGAGITNYTYTDAGQLASVTDPNNKQVSYAYDTTGKPTSTTLSGYGTTTNLYDNAGRLVSVTTPDGQTTSHTYGATCCQAAVMTYGNGATANYTSDSRGRLTSVVNKKSDGTVISSYTYQYDSGNNRIRVTESGNVYVDYFYDDNYQLTRETRRNIVGSQDARGQYTDDPAVYDYSYTYDKMGNRRTMTNHLTSTTTNYTYNNMNQLTTAGDITYTYDANGNLASQTVNGQTRQFAYDFDNRLKQITYPDGRVNTFQYNADGQRVQRGDSSGTTKFIYDGQRLMAETDANNNLTAVYRYFFGLQSMERGASKRYFLFDGQGNTRQLLDAAQNVTDTYTFDAFGKAVSASGTSVNPMRYIGNLIYHTDSDSGLALLGLRYYDPTTGRFITGDPARAEGNDYVYARANPVNRVDPGGT